MIILSCTRPNLSVNDGQKVSAGDEKITKRNQKLKILLEVYQEKLNYSKQEKQRQCNNC